MRRLPRILGSAVLAIGVFAAGNATERKWLYQHYDVNDQGVKVAEFSAIWTYAAANAPMISRILSQDRNGRRFVIRNEVLVQDARTSIQSVSTAERFEFHGSPDGTNTVSFGGQAVIFQESQEESNATRAAVANLLATASTEFKDGVREIGILGAQHASNYSATTYLIRILIYPDIPATNPGDGEALMNVTKDFNANTATVSPFDAAFGAAYYE